jgi:cytochrome c biogenesis factor
MNNKNIELQNNNNDNANIAAVSADKNPDNVEIIKPDNNLQQQNQQEMQNPIEESGLRVSNYETLDESYCDTFVKRI